MTAHAKINLPAARFNIETICLHRTNALEKMRESAEALAAAYAIGREAQESRKLAVMAQGNSSLYRTVADTAYGALFPSHHFDVEKSLEEYRQSIDREIWQYLFDTSGIKKMMDAEALKELRDNMTGDVAEATEANIRATIEGLFADADMIFQRGLVNCFSKLDRRFKSHDGFKIGSRIIFNRAFSEYSGNTEYGSTWDTVADVERVMAVMDGKPPEGSARLRCAVDNDRKGYYGPQQSETETQYFRIKGYKNGNAHLWFTRDDLVEKANKILAEYYGEVLPDAFTDKDDDRDLFSKSRAVSKDLQFYPSPPAVVEVLLKGLGLEGAKVLEPSAGQGAIALAAAAKGAQVDAIEYDARHIDVMVGLARRQGLGLRVTQRNFLKVEPVAKYDFVLMNPPFYGTHWMAHVRHAFEFLAPGGILKAVLPASAEVNESTAHEKFRAWAMKNNDLGWSGPFRDLPPGSFRETGTNINTVTIQLRKR